MEWNCHKCGKHNKVAGYLGETHFVDGRYRQEPLACWNCGTAYDASAPPFKPTPRPWIAGEQLAEGDIVTIDRQTHKVYKYAGKEPPKSIKEMLEREGIKVIEEPDSVPPPTQQPPANH